MIIDQSVAIETVNPTYPEFPFELTVGKSVLNREDENIWGISSAIESLLKTLGLDSQNINKPGWNPFGKMVKPGQTVLIKPNWVTDINQKGNFECLVTHSAIIRPLIDFALKALDGQGCIVIADAPLQNCDFEQLQSKTRIKDLIDEYRKLSPGIDFIIEDWRLTVMERTKFLGKERNTTNKSSRSIDPNRYEVVDVGNDSLLTDIEDFSDRFRVTCYDPDLLIRHHQKGKHEYLVSRRVLEADFIINVPKMKTHIKAGMTGAMKNLIGINGHKEYLPHHIKGAYESGGDNYLLTSRFKAWVENIDEWFWKRADEFNPYLGNVVLRGIGLLWRLARFVSRDGRDAGSWSGNETIWRTMLDLNHILYFYDIETKSFMNAPVRNVFHIMDGVIAGEGEGPLEPEPVPAGKIIAGFSPVVVDAVAARMMGYNLSRLPSIYQGLFNLKSRFSLRDNTTLNITRSNGESVALNALEPVWFKLPKFWKRASTRSIKPG